MASHNFDPRFPSTTGDTSMQSSDPNSLDACSHSVNKKYCAACRRGQQKPISIYVGDLSECMMKAKFAGQMCGCSFCESEEWTEIPDDIATLWAVAVPSTLILAAYSGWAISRFQQVPPPGDRECKILATSVYISSAYRRNSLKKIESKIFSFWPDIFRWEEIRFDG